MNLGIPGIILQSGNTSFDGNLSSHPAVIFSSSGQNLKIIPQSSTGIINGTPFQIVTPNNALQFASSSPTTPPTPGGIIYTQTLPIINGQQQGLLPGQQYFLAKSPHQEPIVISPNPVRPQMMNQLPDDSMARIPQGFSQMRPKSQKFSQGPLPIQPKISQFPLDVQKIRLRKKCGRPKKGFRPDTLGNSRPSQPIDSQNNGPTLPVEIPQQNGDLQPTLPAKSEAPLPPDVSHDEEEEQTKVEPQSSEPGEDGEVKPQVLTHVISGYMIQESREPFPIEKPLWLRVGDEMETEADSTVPLETQESDMEAKPEPEQKSPPPPSTSSPEPDSEMKPPPPGDSPRLCKRCSAPIPPATRPGRPKMFCKRQCAMKHYRRFPNKRPTTVAARLSPLEVATSPDQEEDDEVSNEESILAIADEPVDDGKDAVDVPNRLALPVSEWTVDDVVAFVSLMEGCEKYVQKFRQEDIDGSALLLLDVDALIGHVGLTLGKALKLVDSVSKAKTDAKFRLSL